MAKKDEPSFKTEVISFRVSSDIYEEIRKFGKNERDEAGLPLNPAIAARRLMLEGLNERKKKAEKK